MNPLRLFIRATLATRRFRNVLLIGIAAFVVGSNIIAVEPAEAERHPAVQALIRVGVYLAYFDQINRIAVAQNQLSAADADERLRSKANDLYNRGFTQADFDQLIEQHRRATNGYFSQAEQEVNASTRWPKGIRPETGRPAAKSLLDKAKTEYEAALSARRDPLNGLMGLTVVRGFAMGYESPPSSIDVFGDQWQRITSAMPSATTRDVMGKLVKATQAAAAQNVSQATSGERPIPGEMGPPATGERPIPGEMGGPTAGTRPIPGEMGGSTAAPSRPRIGPVPGERARSTPSASSGIGPQLAGSETGSRIGPVPGERRRVTAVATSPVGPGTPVPPVETASPATPPSPPTPGSGVSPPSAGGPVSPPQPGEDEHAFWARVYAANTREAYEEYLRRYPNGAYADIARAALSIQTPEGGTTPSAQR